MRPALLLLVLAVASSGCASPAKPSDGPVLAIAGNAYDPPRLEAAAGQTVRVLNSDEATHTVTGRGFDTRDVRAGAEGSFVAPATPGEYPFTCAYHPEMKGVLVVA